MHDLPVQTEGELVLPGGGRVWVKTLNTRLFAEAWQAADRYAHRQAAPFMTGGEDRAAVEALFREMTAEDQAAAIATARSRGFVQDAYTTHPEMPAPVRQDDEDEESFSARLERHAADDASLSERRNAYVTTAFEAERTRAATLSPEERLEAYCKARVTEEVDTWRERRIVAEILYRAARSVDDPRHLLRVYESADEVEDLSDEALQRLEQRYVDLSPIGPGDIPTSPSAS